MVRESRWVWGGRGLGEGDGFGEGDGLGKGDRFGGGGLGEGDGFGETADALWRGEVKVMADGWYCWVSSAVDVDDDHSAHRHTDTQK